MARSFVDLVRRHLLPPSASDAITRRLSSGSNKVTGRFRSFDAALAALPAPLTWASDDYLTQREQLFVRQRCELEARDELDVRQQSRMFTLLFPLFAQHDYNRIRILDIGGGFGLDGLLVRRALPSTVAIDWTVIETPDLVRRAAPLHEDGAVRYATSLEGLPAAHYDIAHIRDTIQYLPDLRPLSGQLAGLGCRAVVVGDAPVLAQPDDRIAIQSVRRRRVRHAHPIRLFGSGSLAAVFAPDFRQVARLAQHGGLVVDGRALRNTGLVFLRPATRSYQGEDSAAVAGPGVSDKGAA